jgi:hypothetical protein
MVLANDILPANCLVAEKMKIKMNAAIWLRWIGFSISCLFTVMLLHGGWGMLVPNQIDFG